LKLTAICAGDPKGLELENTDTILRYEKGRFSLEIWRRRKARCHQAFKRFSGAWGTECRTRSLAVAW